MRIASGAAVCLDMLTNVISDEQPGWDAVAELIRMPKIVLMHTETLATDLCHAFLRKLSMLALTGSGSVQGAKWDGESILSYLSNRHHSETQSCWCTIHMLTVFASVQAIPAGAMHALLKGLNALY